MTKLPGMNVEQYRALRRIELLVLKIQREQIDKIRDDFHMLNHTALRRFAETHIKGGQVRLWMIRNSYWLWGQGRLIILERLAAADAARSAVAAPLSGDAD